MSTPSQPPIPPSPSSPDSPAGPAGQAALAAQLALELAALRDALVTLSLSLKDWQYELDGNGRADAHAQLEQVLAGCRAAGKPGNRPGPTPPI